MTIRNSYGYTPNQMEIAAQVLSKAKICRQWARGQANFFDIDLESAEGIRFLDSQSLIHARHLLRDVI